jgi:hypothetical protein
MCCAAYSTASNSFSIYNKIVGSTVTEVSEFSTMEAARESVRENEEDDSSHIATCFDGSWPKKNGHTSLNGITSATCFDEGKVLCMDITSMFCFVTPVQPWNLAVKRTMKEQVVD